MLPRAGGLYVYLREAYGPLMGFLFGWSDFLFNRPAGIGALAIAFVGSVALATGWEATPLHQVVLAALLIAFTAGVNIAGVVWGGGVALITTIVKAGFLAIVTLLPFVMLLWGGTSVDAANYASTVMPRQETIGAQLGVVLLAVMWAYNGWHGITPLAEEVRNPGRNIPLALFGGVAILTALYVSANIAYHGVLSMNELRAAGDHGAEKMLGKLLGPVGLTLMAGVVMCSTFSGINSNVLYAPRITFAMGRDRVFFPALGRVHPRFRTPAAAIATTALMAIALVIIAATGKEFVSDIDVTTLSGEVIPLVVGSLQNDSIFGLLTNFVIFSASIFYSLSVLAVIVLRYRLPNAKRPYRTWGYPLVPLLFLTVYVWFLAQVYVGKPLESRLGLVLIAFGIPVYYIYRARARREQ